MKRRVVSTLERQRYLARNPHEAQRLVDLTEACGMSELYTLMSEVFHSPAFQELAALSDAIDAQIQAETGPFVDPVAESDG